MNVFRFVPAILLLFFLAHEIDAVPSSALQKAKKVNQVEPVSMPNIAQRDKDDDHDDDHDHDHDHGKDDDGSEDGSDNGSGDGSGGEDEDDDEDDDKKGSRPTQTIPNSASSAAGTGDPACFPKNARVTMSNGETKTLGELKVGDRVAVGGGLYSEVFMFTHRLSAGEYKFVQLITANGAVLRASDQHYIRVEDQLKAAAAINAGDLLTLENGQQTEVESVSYVNDVGLYNPQTVHGDIVINGIVSSTYTTAVHAKIAHSALAPLRCLAAHFGSAIEFRNGIAAFVSKVLRVGGDYVASA